MKIKLACLLAAAWVAVLPASADTFKVGYVDIQRILRDAPEAVAAQRKIEAEFSKREQELSRLAKHIQAAEESLNKNGVTLSDSERRSKEREIADLTRDFQRKQREFREDLTLRQNEETAALLEKASKAARHIFSEDNYDLIIQEALLWKPAIDITDRVIKAMSAVK